MSDGSPDNVSGNDIDQYEGHDGPDVGKIQVTVCVRRLTESGNECDHETNAGHSGPPGWSLAP